jgi:hypothetical protein
MRLAAAPSGEPFCASAWSEVCLQPADCLVVFSVNVSRQLLERLNCLEARVVLCDPLESEREEIDCRRQSLHHLVAEPPSWLVHSHEARQLTIQREASDRENSSVLLRRESEQLEIVIGFHTEIRQRRAGEQRSSNRRRKMIDCNVERRTPDTARQRSQSSRNQRSS